MVSSRQEDNPSTTRFRAYYRRGSRSRCMRRCPRRSCTGNERKGERTPGERPGGFRPVKHPQRASLARSSAGGLYTQPTSRPEFCHLSIVVASAGPDCLQAHRDTRGSVQNPLIYRTHNATSAPSAPSQTTSTVSTKAPPAISELTAPAAPSLPCSDHRPDWRA